MRRHAKATSAGSTAGSGNSLGSVRRAFAARGASSLAKGSSAPAHRSCRRIAPLGLVLLAAFALALALAPAALAAEGVTSTFGGTGTLGGQLTGPKGVAVNDSSGDVYAVDATNQRIDEFSSSGAFIQAWGWDVVSTGPDNAGTAEVQSVKVAATSGTFTLTYSGQTTSALASNASAATVESALNALSTIGGASGSVSVTGGPGDATGSNPYVVTFGGALRGQNLSQMTSNTAGLGAGTGTQLSCGGGPAEATLTYQWLRNGAVINGATSSTYTTIDADEGDEVQCRVLATGADGATAKASAAVPASPFPATAPPSPGTPTVTGTASVGSILTCGNGTWTGSPTYAYQWLRNGAPISTATNATYTLVAADKLTAIQCEVTGTNGGGSVVAESAATNILPAAPTMNAAPTISGTLAVGQTLTCASGTWSGSPSFTYQWLRNGAVIASATSQTYELQAADAGKAIQCQVTATNSEGTANAVTVNSVVPTVPSPLPPTAPATISVTGTHAVGSELTCSKGTWGNSTGASYEYQWLRNGAPISGANSGASTATTYKYKLVEEDKGKSVQCQIVATTSTGASEGLSPSASTVTSPSIAAATASLSGGPVATVETTTDGAPAFEKCIAANGDVCKAGVAGGGAGQLDAPQAVAVNQSTGNLYVAEATSHRVSEFDSSGNFLRAWGWDVVESGPDNTSPRSAVESVEIPSTVTEGTFTLTYDGETTNPINYSATASAVSDQFTLITALRSGRAPVVTGGPGATAPYTFTFSGEFANQPVPQITVNGENLVGGTATATTTTTGVSNFEVCNVVANPSDVCKVGNTGAGAGQLAGPAGIAIDPTTGDVYVADQTNLRISEFSPSGSHIETFGWGALKGQPNSGSTPLETCTETCVKGVSTTEGFKTAPQQIAVDSSGAVYATDNGYFSLLKFNPAFTNAETFASAKTTGTSAATAPINVLVEPGTDRPLVVKPTATASETQVLEFDSAGDFVSAHYVGAGLPVQTGFAYYPAGQSLYYATAAGNGVIPANSIGVLSFTPTTVPAPVVTISEPTNVGSTTATFNGSVGPEGFATTYHFEYSTNGVSWTKFPTTNASAGNGTSAVPVSKTVAGLAANTDYFVRLVATNSGGTITSAEATVETSKAAPLLSQVVASSVTGTTVKLTGYIDPRNSPTSYRFEYGTTTAYGSQVPADFELFTGSGNQFLPVSAAVSGLQPGTTYHFRLVATSPGGTADSPDMPFLTPAASCSNGSLRAQSDTNPTTGQPYSEGLPECRAYEMVTPLEKGGVDVQLSSVGAVTGAEGNTVGFSTIGSTSDPNNFSGVNLNPFLAQRGESGWSNSSSFAPASMIAATGGVSDDSVSYSADLSKVWECGEPTPSASYPGKSIVCAIREADGSWVTSPAYPSLAGNQVGLVGNNGASSDLSHVVFQMENDAHLLPADTHSGSGHGGIYEIEGLGTPTPVLRLVDVDNSGNVIGPTTSNNTSTFLGSAGGGNAGAGVDYQAVSGDGNTIYFTATPTGGTPTLYARTRDFAGGTPTSPVTVAVSNPSPSECTTCSSGGGLPVVHGFPNGFVGASADGSKVFFLTSQQLVNADTDSTVDLYEYDFDNPAGHHIVQVSAGDASDPTPGSGANVLGLLRISPNGSHVYFAATGVLTTAPNGNGQIATQGSDNIYCFDTETDAIEFVASVPPGDSSLWAAEGYGAVQTTPDGRYLLFDTSAQLSPADTNGAEDVYRYDSQTGSLLLISSGTGNQNAEIGPFPSLHTVGALADVNDLTRAISTDGSSIVFSTSAALQSDDVNNANDVYLWHDGTVSLISDGQDPAGADPQGALVPPRSSPTISPSGSNIFFSTRAQLVGTDTDSLSDVYDARIGGGFPHSAPSSCADSEACQGAASQPAPSTSTPGSSTLSGPGNEPTPPPAKKPHKKKGRGKPHKKHVRKAHHARHANANRRAGK